MQIKKTLIKKMIYVLILSIVFIISSLFWTTDTAHNQDEMSHVEFGWPSTFIVQNQSIYSPPFPFAVKANFNIWEISNDFLWIPFWQNIFLNSLPIALVWFLFSLTLKNFSKKKDKKSIE